MTATNRVPQHEGFSSPHVRRPLCEDLLCAACATGGGGVVARRSKTAQVLLSLIVQASKEN